MTGIRYTEDAVRDLEEIYRYIAEDNINAAIEHRRRLIQRCLGLVDQPVWDASAKRSNQGCEV